MPSERSAEVKFEIGHVLFIDIVGYSKLLIALSGPTPIEIFARVAAQAREPDRAIAALTKLLSIPYASPLAANVPLTPALLKLDPMFDPLRNDPRFAALLANKEK